MDNRCVMCGEVIPEGWLVCYQCQNKPIPQSNICGECSGFLEGREDSDKEWECETCGGKDNE